ncbi:hypothetical protein Tco_1561376 [Tanacetum coccineum]
MSSASSAVTYTTVYIDSEPRRSFWGADEELSGGGSPRVIIYGYDGLPMQPISPPSLDYVPGLEHPPSPDYEPGPAALPADASPTALSPGYVVVSNPEEDPEEDHADYPADGGDGDDEPTNDDDGTDDEDEEPSEDEDDDKVEEGTGAARQPRPTLEADLRRGRVEEIEHRGVPAMHLDREATHARRAWTGSEDRSVAIEAYVKILESQTQLTTTLGHIKTLEARDPEPQDKPAEVEFRQQLKRTTRTPPATATTTPITNAQLRTLIERGVIAALAEHDANMSENGDNNHNSGTGRRGQVSTVCECLYTDFLKCQPMNFKGTEGVVGLTQWVEKMEFVFLISNCTIEFPLMSDRMFPGESAKVERYVGGLPEMIHDIDTA